MKGSKRKATVRRVDSHVVKRKRSFSQGGRCSHNGGHLSIWCAAGWLSPLRHCHASACSVLLLISAQSVVRVCLPAYSIAPSSFDNIATFCRRCSSPIYSRRRRPLIAVWLWRMSSLFTVVRFVLSIAFTHGSVCAELRIAIAFLGESQSNRISQRSNRINRNHCFRGICDSIEA